MPIIATARIGPMDRKGLAERGAAAEMIPTIKRKDAE
jgi:hypothetical protein